jgi:hypothetical protein
VRNNGQLVVESVWDDFILRRSTPAPGVTECLRDQETMVLVQSRRRRFRCGEDRQKKLDEIEFLPH